MADQTFKVAVATRNEEYVDLHFGHTDTFCVYEVDAETGEWVDAELRKISRTGCDGGGCGGSAVFDSIAEQLSDVEYVLAVKIGPQAVNSLSRKNIIALDVVAPVEEALHKVRDYRDKRHLLAQRAKQLLEESDPDEKNEK